MGVDSVRLTLLAVAFISAAAAFYFGAQQSESARTGTYFPNCAAARAAGAAPLFAGEPGYRPPLDADGDGIACEPYR